ncbi:hypothetical protein ACFY5C_18955 [Streptomyces sp. NPDC012935]|uniref:hypothetical protein n=1 Tax=Streptomyces sp. NPDC012935 TaxID=3364857 RepID=UPI00368E77C2
MFEYDLHHIRSADMIREAEHDRMVREAIRVRRAAKRSAKGAAVAESHTSRLRRLRHPRAA